MVWKDWREALGGRAVSKKKTKEEEEGDLLGAFFFRIYEFLFTISNPIHRPHVPERYAIKFVPAAAVSALPPVFSLQPTSVISSSVHSVSAVPPDDSVIDYSVISSVNFVPTAFPDNSVTNDFSVVSSVNFIPAHLHLVLVQPNSYVL